MNRIATVALVLLLVGCTAGPLQWAGIAIAHELRDRTIVEMQLHAGHFGEGATAQTARAGIRALDHVEAISVAGASVNATTTIDQDNATILFTIPQTGFDAFHMNATFVLTNGTRIDTRGIEWHEEFRRPLQAGVALAATNGATTIDIAMKEVKDVDQVDPIGVKAVATWTTHVTGENGTSFDDATLPVVRNGALSLTLPYGSIQEVALRYHLQLSDGRTVSDREVDGDHYPNFVNTQLAAKQEN